MKKRKNNYTVLFIPDDNARTVSMRVNRIIIRLLIAVLVIFSVGILGLLYFSGGIALKLQLVSTLRNENRRLSDENKVLLELSQKVVKLDEMNNYFRRLALGADREAEIDIPATRKADVPAGKAKSVDIHETSSGAEDAPGLKPSAGEPQEHFFEVVPYIRPVEGWITREFYSGPKIQDIHRGIDFAAAHGTPIRATAPGIVKEITNDKYIGKIVAVEHLFGFLTRYGHCSQILVKIGNHVARGQTIALVGNTGRSSAPHLHYEILKDGEYVDPRRYIIDHNSRE